MPKKQMLKLGLIIGTLLVAAVLLNSSTFFQKPSAELPVKSTDGQSLRVAENEATFPVDDIKDIKQGEDVVLLLTDDGDVYASGLNRYGQLASGKFGDESRELKEIEFPEKINVSRIDMSHSHAIALTDKGDVWTWGMNLSGQLGDNSRDDSNRPVKVFADAKAIAAGYRFSAAVKSNGELWAWGMNCDPNLPGLTELTREFANDISLGGTYYDGPGGNEAVHCLNQQNLPIGSLKPKKVAADAKFTDVSGGYGHLLMLDEKNQAWGFGCNGWGQLGRGHHRNDPGTRKVEKVALPSGTRVTMLDAGFRHSMAVDQNGNLWIWGYFNETDEDLKYGESRYESPQRIKIDGRVTAIEAGEDISGIRLNDKFYAAGNNKIGQIDPAASNKGEFLINEFRKVSDRGNFSLSPTRSMYW